MSPGARAADFLGKRTTKNPGGKPEEDRFPRPTNRRQARAMARALTKGKKYGTGRAKQEARRNIAAALRAEPEDPKETKDSRRPVPLVRPDTPKGLGQTDSGLYVALEDPVAEIHRQR